MPEGFYHTYAVYSELFNSDGFVNDINDLNHWCTANGFIPRQTLLLPLHEKTTTDDNHVIWIVKRLCNARWFWQRSYRF